MKSFIVGTVNIETSAKIEGFPFEYQAGRFNHFGNHCDTSGVGLNLAVAQAALGAEVALWSYTGADLLREAVLASLKMRHISCDFVFPQLKETLQTVMLYDQSGRRAMISDIKDMQDLVVDVEKAKEAMQGYDLIMMTNSNMARQMIPVIRAQEATIVTDIHQIYDLDNNDYNHDFLNTADLVFFSNEGFEGQEEMVIRRLAAEHPMRVIVCGLGAQGALAWNRADGSIIYEPAKNPRPVENTVGGGDSLCASFSYFWVQGLSISECLKRATMFAGWKVGAKGGAQGQLTLDELERLL